MRLKLVSIDEKQLKDYLIIIQKIKPIMADKAAVLAERMAVLETKMEKREIYRSLVEANLKNVVHIASRYRGAGVTFAALIAAGNIALIQYVRNIKAEYNENFSDAALWHIEGAVIDCVVKARKKISL